jgi:hypothetical protein
MMNNSMMNVLLGKMFGDQNNLSKDRAFQLGILAGMMPGMQGLMMAALIARRERPPAKADAPK